MCACVCELGERMSRKGGKEGERLTAAAFLSLISARAETIRGNGEGQGKGGSLGKMGTGPLRRWYGVGGVAWGGLFQLS